MECTTGRESHRLEHGAPVSAVRFVPSGASLTSTTELGAVIAPNGQVLVIGDTHGKLSWWDIRKKSELFSDSAGVFTRTLASSPNGGYLVTIDADDSARVWEFEGGREIKRLPFVRYLTAIAISPDSRFFATCGDDGWNTRLVEVTEIWSADPVAKACSQVSRNLTREEWRQYMGNEPYRDTCPDIAWAGFDSQGERSKTKHD